MSSAKIRVAIMGWGNLARFEGKVDVPFGMLSPLSPRKLRETLL